jgi:cytosine/adenosine deaminase-related metal-dependent hydrolase
MAELPCRSLRARYVFTGLGPPIAEGTVTIRGPRIVAVGREPRGELLDLGDAAILPGLVNAHTHLDLSDVDAPLGSPGMGLVEWIGLVMTHRRGRATADPVGLGIAESRRLGTTSLGEMAQPGWPAESFLAGRLDASVFLELIAPTASRVDPVIELARRHLSPPLPSGEGWGEGTLGQAGNAGGAPLRFPESAVGDWADEGRLLNADGDVFSQFPLTLALSRREREPWASGLGLAPHAPYTVHPELLRQAVRLATAAGAPIAFHLAESREELELLATGQGPLREMLAKMDAWDEALWPGPRRPLDYLKELAAAPRTLVIHGNYLDDEETDFLARRAERMALVYCPRTHAYFRHAPYPLARLLARGVTVALGTDSRASSPDLSILAEMRLVARQHPEIARPTILRLGTLGGAQALGIDHSVGTIEPGKLAHLAIVALADRDAADPYDLLFDSDAPVVGRWWRGEPDSPP